MTFDDFLEISAEGDFSLKDIDPKQGTYDFQSHFGDRIHIRKLPAPLNESIQPWVILVNGEKVEFKDPSQLVTVNTIVTGLCSKALQKIVTAGKKQKTK